MAMSKRHIASQRKFAAGLLRDRRFAGAALQQLHFADRDRCRES
jgi:hypothetical protein